MRWNDDTCIVDSDNVCKISCDVIEKGLVRARKRVNQPTPAPEEDFKKKEVYYLFNPKSPRPPKVKYETLAEAESMQKVMCKKHPNEEFIILKAVSSAKLKRKLLVNYEEQFSVTPF